jgi:hypothetical protein
MNKNTIQLIGVAVLAVSIAAPFMALAQQTPPTEGLTIDRIISILKRFVSWIFTVLLIVAVIFIIIAAFKYLTGGGDPKAVGDASRALLFAAIAIGVGLLSVGLIALVGQLLGVTAGGWNPFGATSGVYPSPSSEQIPTDYGSPYPYPDPSTDAF